MSTTETPSTPPELGPEQPWYRGITPYMWLVLLIASLGWVFDVFEGQLFVAFMERMMKDLEPGATREQINAYNSYANSAFLIGGGLGGVLFGMLSDRIGRTKTMIITILVYSLFACLTALAQNWWQVALFRFCVALGAGGEWAVASAMVAEVFPRRARAQVGSIFHASSVFGTYLAVLVGWLMAGTSWRWAFVLGAIPALLTLWIRMRLREPEQWVRARERDKETADVSRGRIGDIFRGQLLRRTLLGVSLATVGLATFWGVHIYGKNFMKAAAQRQIVATADVQGAEAVDALLVQHAEALNSAEMLGMFLVTTGGGLGLVLFGPIAARIGRRKTFLFYQIGGLILGLLMYKGIEDPSRETLMAALPIFGFFTLGMHAGFAIYFPELYPTRLRGTGAGFCFNAGRFSAAIIVALIGMAHLPLADSATIFSLLFIPGMILLWFAPETLGRELPE